MRKVGFLAIFILLSLASIGVQAQQTSALMCGDTVSDRFGGDTQSHRYDIDIPVGTTLVVHALPITAPITVAVDVLNANGALIGSNDFSPEESPAVIETSQILASGTYQIIVSADTEGDYQLFVSCISDDGEVTSNNNLVQGMTCGDQIDNTMIRPDELHRYFLYLEADTVMDVFLEALYGDFAEMTFDLGLFSPTNQELDRINPDFKDTERSIFEQTITGDGIYRLYVQGFDSVDENYRLSIDCTLPDGSLALSGSENRRVLESTQLSPAEPAENMPPPDTSDDESEDGEDQPAPIIPIVELIEGIPNTGQLMGEDAIIGYTFMGTEGETITVVYQRVRGESELDLWLQSPAKDMIFTSSMLLAHKLSAELILPEDGEYTIFLTLTERPQVADAVFMLDVMREQ